MPLHPALRALIRAPTLQNTGSTARDHLASERTFLAWLRTGLGFVALGIAVERFSQFELELGASGPPLTSSPSIGSTGAQTEAERLQQTTAKLRQSQQRVQREQLLVAALLGTGVGGIVYGSARYFSTLVLLEQGLFKPAYKGAAGVGLCVAGLAGCAWWGMVQEEERAVERRHKNDTATSSMK